MQKEYATWRTPAAERAVTARTASGAASGPVKFRTMSFKEPARGVPVPYRTLPFGHPGRNPPPCGNAELAGSLGPPEDQGTARSGKAHSS